MGEYSYDRRASVLKRAVDSIGKLYDYLNKTPAEKGLEIAERKDERGEFSDFLDWVMENYSPGESNDPTVQMVLDADDPFEIVNERGFSIGANDFLPETMADYYDSYQWDTMGWSQPNSSAPSWYRLENPKVVRGQWLIHFTNHAQAIARQGFKYGVHSLENLGSAESNAYKAKGSKGKFNFAYLLADPTQYSKGERKYGGEAVLFKAPGVSAWSPGDQETQVIFQGNTAKDIIPLTEEFGLWYANGLGSGGQLERDGFGTLPEAVAWVVRNFGTYKRELLTPR